MGDVTGPISTLPGARHEVPKGAMCDQHGDRPAVANIQGETDSFGCETLYCCQECADSIMASLRSPEARTGRCDYCKTEVTDLANFRDFEEGMAGPVYRVCAACRKRVRDDLAAELAEYDDDWDDGPFDDC